MLTFQMCLFVIDLAMSLKLKMKLPGIYNNVFKNLFMLVTFTSVKIFVKYLRKIRIQVVQVSAPYRLQEHLRFC